MRRDVVVAAARKAQTWPLSRLIRGSLDRWFYRFAYAVIPPLFRLLWRMDIRGLENFPTTGAVVIACNHRSNLDPFFLGSSCPRQIHFMAKAELWKFKPLGCLVGKLGTFPVHRGQIDREAVRHAKAVLVGGAVLGLFPEGHRQRERDLGDIRPGVSLFSLQEGVVTVPVILKGTDRVVKNGILHFPRITAIYGKPIDLPGEDVPKGQRPAVVRERLVQSFHDLLGSTGSARG